MPSMFTATARTISPGPKPSLSHQGTVSNDGQSHSITASPSSFAASNRAPEIGRTRQGALSPINGSS